MSTDVLIKVEGISKKYCKDFKKSMQYGLLDIADEFLFRNSSAQLRKKEFWAVSDVGFEVRRGECMGLIGHNGSGKSSILKMMNGLIKPNKGRIEIQGRVGAMIQLGAGFNPLLNGRENIYVNGAILGFTKNEIDRKFDEIVAFAEIEDYLDMPVYNYSSGMYVKLGFSVAIHLEPDILLIDEVLAVGDLGFRQKCFNKMEGLLDRCAMVFVSHSVPQITRICNKLMVLDRGRSVYYSESVSEGLDLYTRGFHFEKNVVHVGNKARLLYAGVSDKKRYLSERRKEAFSPESDIQIWIELEMREPLEQPAIVLDFMDKENRRVARTSHAFIEGFGSPGRKHIEAIVPGGSFPPGWYMVNIVLSEYVNGTEQVVSRGNAMIEFSVTGRERLYDQIQNGIKWSYD